MTWAYVTWAYVKWEPGERPGDSGNRVMAYRVEDGSGGRTVARGLARALALAAGVALLGLLGAGEARADFRVCNETDETVGVSLGYKSSDGWVSEGWWHVPGEDCEVLISGALTSRFYYLYAENAERSQRWGGASRMCTAEEEFKIVGVGDCIPRGYARMGFGEYDTGDQQSWTVRLTPASGAAEAAALTGTTSTTAAEAVAQ